MKPKKISLTQNKLSEILEATAIACNLDELKDISKQVIADRQLFEKIAEGIEIKAREKTSHVFDVFAEVNLAERLKGLSIEQLKDIVNAHRLDSNQKVRKWKEKEKVEEFIIDTVETKKKRTSVFY